MKQETSGTTQISLSSLIQYHAKCKKYNLPGLILIIYRQTGTPTSCSVSSALTSYWGFLVTHYSQSSAIMSWHDALERQGAICNLVATAQPARSPSLELPSLALLQYLTGHLRYQRSLLSREQLAQCSNQDTAISRDFPWTLVRGESPEAISRPSRPESPTPSDPI